MAESAQKSWAPSEFPSWSRAVRPQWNLKPQELLLCHQRTHRNLFCLTLERAGCHIPDSYASSLGSFLSRAGSAADSNMASFL